MAITLDQAKDLFTFDNEAGRLFWRISRGRAVRGAEVGAWHRTGYRHTCIDRKIYLVHRVIWLLAYGEWPGKQIDHIDGDPANNRLENIRLVSDRDNSRNRALKVCNKSGISGVYWDKRSVKWCAQISTNEGRKHLGHFARIEDAADARKVAEQLYGYHANHGRKKSPSAEVVE